MNDEVNEINTIITHLRWSFIENNHEFILRINEIDINFFKSDSDFEVKPDEWFRSKHEDGHIHEPGMIAILLWIEKTFPGPKTFYDVGSLFGYFSIIVDKLWPDVRIKAVEGNPKSARCITQISCGNKNIEVINCVLGSDSSKKRYFISNFNFIPVWSFRGFSVGFFGLCKNFVKRFLGFFFSTLDFKYRDYSPFLITGKKLIDIFVEENHGVLEVFKFDTEGFQSIFIPPFIDDLCYRKAIILMEFDHPEQMNSFNSSNKKMLELFTVRGYQAIWLNHREATGVKFIEAVTSEEDRNSLCVLLPEHLLPSSKLKNR